MFPPRAYSPPQTPEFINARLSSNLKLDDRPRPHHGNDEKKSDPRPTIRHATHSSSKSNAPASANQLSGRKSKQHLRPAQSRTSLKTVSETDALPNQSAESAPSNHRAKVEKPLVDEFVSKGRRTPATTSQLTNDPVPSRESAPPWPSDFIQNRAQQDLKPGLHPSEDVSHHQGARTRVENQTAEIIDRPVEPDPPTSINNQGPTASDITGHSTAAPILPVSHRRAFPEDPSPQTIQQLKSVGRTAVNTTSDTMAEYWEAELARGAQLLTISAEHQTDAPSQIPQSEKGKNPEQSLSREREEQRKKDAEWEKSGMWLSDQTATRDAEERTRRDAGRPIGMHLIA